MQPCGHRPTDAATPSTPPTQEPACTAAGGDAGLAGDPLGRQLADGGLLVPPLTEVPEHDGAVSGPMAETFEGSDAEPLGNELGCAVDLLVAESTGSDL